MFLCCREFPSGWRQPYTKGAWHPDLNECSPCPFQLAPDRNEGSKTCYALPSKNLIYKSETLHIHGKPRHSSLIISQIGARWRSSRAPTPSNFRLPKSICESTRTIELDWIIIWMGFTDRERQTRSRVRVDMIFWREGQRKAARSPLSTPVNFFLWFLWYCSCFPLYVWSSVLALHPYAWHVSFATYFCTHIFPFCSVFDTAKD